MGRDVQCFLLEKTGFIRLSLRRYTNDGGECAHPQTNGYHQAKFLTPDELPTPDDSLLADLKPGETRLGISYDDARWPSNCVCGFKFGDGVRKQLFTEELYRRADNGEVITLREAPHGAMWFSEYLEEYPRMCGPDGKALIVKVMTSEWHVDGKCNNCTMPEDNVHKCWIRHGTVPNITVDKNGVTCSAGGGSIWVNQGRPNDWHGFLRNGRLEEC